MNNLNIMGRIATDLILRPVRSSAGVVVNFKVAVDRYAGGNKFKQREYVIIFQRAI